MVVIWTLDDFKHFDILEKIGNEMIYPYRDKLSPKSTSIKTESISVIYGN